MWLSRQRGRKLQRKHRVIEPGVSREEDIVLENRIHGRGGDRREGQQDKLGYQGLWTSGKVGLELILLTRGCRCVAKVEDPLERGEVEAGRLERGGMWGCLSWSPGALQGIKK